MILLFCYLISGKYTSCVSQADADNQAQTDVNNNKQSYANSHGECDCPPAKKPVCLNLNVDTTDIQSCCDTSTMVGTFELKIGSTTKTVALDAGFTDCSSWGLIEEGSYPVSATFNNLRCYSSTHYTSYSTTVSPSTLVVKSGQQPSVTINLKPGC